MPAVFHTNLKTQKPWGIVLEEDGSFVIFHFGQVLFCLVCHDVSVERFENVHRIVRLLYQQQVFDEDVFQAFRNSINGQIIDLTLSRCAI